MSDYKIDISVETRQAIKELNNLANAGKDAGTVTSDAGKESSAAWDTFKGVLGAQAFVAGFNAIKGAASSLYNTFITNGVAAANATEQATNRLTSALANNGDTSGKALKELQKFADEMQATTVHGDDATLALAAKATQMGLTTEQTKNMIRVTADLSAANGKGLEPSFKALQAAMAGSTGALEKMFPAQAEMIRNAEGMDEILAIVGDRVAGQATQQFRSFSGQLVSTSNTFTEIQKIFGFAITQNEDVISGFLDLNAVLETVRQFVDSNKDAIADLVSFGMTLLIGSLKITVEAVTGFINLIQDNINWLKLLGAGLTFSATALGAYTIAMNASAIATTAVTVATNAFRLALLATPIGLIVGGLTLIGAGLYAAHKNWEELTATVKVFAGEMIGKVMPAIDFVLSGLAGLAGLFSKDLAQSINDSIASIQGYSDALIGSGEATLSDIEAKKAAVAAEKELADAKAEAAESEVAVAEQLTVAREEAAQVSIEIQKKHDAELEKLRQERFLAEEEMALRKLNAETIRADERLAKLIEDLGFEEAIKTESRMRMLEADKENAESTLALERLKEETKNQSLQRQLENLGEHSLQRAELLEKQAQEDAERRQKELEDAKRARQEEHDFDVQVTKAQEKWATDSWRRRAATASRGFNELASLQKSSSKEQAAIGKAAAISQTLINTYMSATSSFSSLASIPVVGPALGTAAAAAAIKNGLDNVKQIRAQRFSQGGIVGGANFHGDNQIARVNSGELILNKSQQNNLANRLTRGEGMEAVVSVLEKLRHDVRSLQLRIGDSDVMNAVNREIRSGRRLANV